MVLMPLETMFGGIKALTTPLIQPLFIPLLYYTLAALGTILSFWTKGDRIQDEQDSLNPQPSMIYDFIIVGAGSAGSLLANRLSRNYNVLLLEAGGEVNPLQYIPAFSLFLTNYEQVDWRHRTVPQKFASLNSIAQESSWSTGLGLGGTGTLNYMIHLRGHRRDFDNWARITGDNSWSWEGVLPYFKSYEDYQVPGDNVNHGYGGDLRIEAPDFIGRARDFVAAGAELGYPNVDLNAPFAEGFDIIRSPIKRGVRQAPYKAFLEPIRTRSSLRILKFAHVNKVLFRNGNVAYGVEYDRHGRTYIAEARREVVCSAGTVGTPKILMLSGVGPTEHLQEHSIPVVSNLPVGQNLQDHLSVYLAPFFIREGLGTYFDRDFTPGELIKYFTLGRGRLTSTGCEASGAFSSEFAKARGEGSWPDIQLFSYAFTNFRVGARLFSQAFSLKLDEIMKYMENDIGRDSLYIVVSGARPLSRGFIKLGGPSPYDRQIIDPNYLSDPEQVDLKVLIEGVEKAMFLMENTTAMKRIGTRFTTTRLPGCEHLPFRTTSYWECFVRRYSVTIHHPVGTAAMGSVVDSQLRVVGTTNLRVVDASVQPVVVVTNTQASTLMIAERAADMILTYWNNQNVVDKQPQRPGKWGGGLGGILSDNFFWKNKRQEPYYTKGPILLKPTPSYAPPSQSSSPYSQFPQSPPTFSPPSQPLPTFSSPSQSPPTSQDPPTISSTSQDPPSPQSPASLSGPILLKSQFSPLQPSQSPPPSTVSTFPQLEPMPKPEKLQQLSYYQRPKLKPANSYYDYDYYDDTRSTKRGNKANFTASNNIDDPEDFFSYNNF